LGWKEAKRKRGRKERRVYLLVMMRLEPNENSCSSALIRTRLEEGREGGTEGGTEGEEDVVREGGEGGW